MGLRCGIVGLPNVGKSTLFNALTQAGVDSANYPFCTIEPNIGIVPVPDPRLEAIAERVHPQNVTPATVTFVDIAGLVKGAHKGEGLGNQFLAHIREVDAILHVVRCFRNEAIVHVEGSVDPIRDIEIVELELALKDMETVEKRIEKLAKRAKSEKGELQVQLRFFERILSELSEGKPIRMETLDEKEQMWIRESHLLMAKPVLYVCNVEEYGAQNPYSKEVERYARSRGFEAIEIAAELEAQIAQMDPKERHAFLQLIGVEEPGLNRLIRKAYALLGLQTFFTAGEKEVRAWTIRKGTKAPEAAGVIHSDFERGFIRAEVIAFEDFLRYGSEQEVRKAGKLRLEGREYVVQDGDILFFRFNV